MVPDIVRGHLDLLVLATIEQGSTYGYAIAEQLRLRSDGAFDLAEGTLYPALYRLEDAGLLKSHWTRVNGRRRRVYKLTRRGRAALASKAREWTTFSHAVAQVVVGGST